MFSVATGSVCAKNARSVYYAEESGMSRIFDIRKAPWNTEREGFANQYPRLSDNPVFSNITVDIKTTTPCVVYYKITPTEKIPLGDFQKLCETDAADTVYTVNIRAVLHERYDVHFKILKKDGSFSGTKTIKDVMPMSIAIGNGTKNAPYIIFTDKQLMEISNAPKKHYMLGDDITLSGNWESIPKFSGTLDGAGHKISGLVSETNNDNAGLFCELNNGTVKNLYVDGICTADKNAGIIAAKNEGGIISGCTVTGEVTAKVNNAGGIVGVNNGEITDSLSACYVVRAGSFAGGIAGSNFGKIKNSLAAVDITAAEMYAGAISGTNDGIIENCVAANMNVYDTLTYNSGKLTTNKHSGVTHNNYCLDIMSTNAVNEEEGEYSQCGYSVRFDGLKELKFYDKIGWNVQNWKNDEDFLLPVPKALDAKIALTEGRTMYLPKAIKTASALSNIDKNSQGHYILKNDITLREPWKTLCMLDGFSGTLDGAGHTIYNLNLKTETGMFSNITGGTVKNIIFKNVSANPSECGGIIAACNYGYIENCELYGEINATKAGFFGGCVSENYGQIINIKSCLDIVNNSKNASVGGIASDNSGIIMGCTYQGKITAESENALIGGICAMSGDEGQIFECFSHGELILKAQSGFVGGICAIAEGSEIYKAAATGNIQIDSDGMIYAGAIAASVSDGIIYNAMSQMNIRLTAPAGFAGGIAGCVITSNVQNTYSLGNIITLGDVRNGGICGYGEASFVMQNVAMMPEIKSEGATGAVIGEYEMCEVSDNFSAASTLVNGKRVVASDKNGETKLVKAFETEFFFKPVVQGGKLGWPSEKYDDAVWSNGKATGYNLPVLCEVRGMEYFTMPKYK